MLDGTYCTGAVPYLELHVLAREGIDWGPWLNALGGGCLIIED